jgi:hypothetical protein
MIAELEGNGRGIEAHACFRESDKMGRDMN